MLAKRVIALAKAGERNPRLRPSSDPRPPRKPYPASLEHLRPRAPRRSEAQRARLLQVPARIRQALGGLQDRYRQVAYARSRRVSARARASGSDGGPVTGCELRG